MKLSLVSDTHGELAWLEEVPPCDILIHAGDICPDHWKNIWCRKDLGRSALWIKEVLLPRIQQLLDDGIIKHFAFTAGNHDWVSRREAQSLSSAQIHFLIDSEAVIDGLRIWGSPWSNTFYNWAWMQDPEDLASIYSKIPECDVLISHQPPISAGSQYHDLNTHRIERIGSVELDSELLRIKPKLVVCGHIHSGHGEYDHHSGAKIINAAWLDEIYRPKYPIETFEL